MKKFVVLMVLLALVFGLTAVGFAEDKPVFYWISHGTPNDPIWVHAINGANQAAEALDVEVKTSFHQNDIASQKEAFQSAIASGADGIASSSPQPGALKEEIEQAKSEGIPVVLLNADDPDTARDAFVGASLFQAGQ